MREHVNRNKKTTTGFSIPSLKHPTRGFGLESSAISRQAVPEIQSLNKPLTHDISRIPLHTQAKLSISQPGDIYEQEADSVAQQVMQRMAQPVNRQSIQREALPMEEEELQMKPLANSITPLVQREALPMDEEELQMKPMVQRQAGMAAAPDLETSINQARGGGQVIADNIREPMEVAFGADFSGVKVHTDGQSDQLNRSIQARAFTTGQDVFFRQGEYNPGSRGGQELLAHELTHVVQQNSGAVQRSLLPPQQLLQYPAIENPGASGNDRTIQAKGEMTGNRQDYTIEKITSSEGLTIQRLALQYGNKPPIPEDAKNLAALQDQQRRIKIAVQDIDGNGGSKISDQVYKDMANREDTFLVAHGRPALGNQPAMLESGEGSTLNGSNLADIINTIRSGLEGENKTLGSFKIEACMSSLSRKTSGGSFGGFFVKESPSLLADTKSSLEKTYKVTDITLKGNPGFSAGSELENGVENTTPAGTEIGLLDPLSAGIRENEGDSKKADPMIADALNIIDKQKDLLNTADKIKTLQLQELHGQASTANYLKQSFAAFKTKNPPDFTLESVITVLVGYVKSQAQKK